MNVISCRPRSTRMPKCPCGTQQQTRIRDIFFYSPFIVVVIERETSAYAKMKEYNIHFVNRFISLVVARLLLLLLLFGQSCDFIKIASETYCCSFHNKCL